MPSCAVCGTEAPSEKHLRQHIKSKHDDRVLKCEECDVTCKGAMKLKMHKNIHRVGFYQKRALGGTSRVKKSQRSTAQFNVLHAGFAKQSDLQLRKPNKNKIEVVEICSI